MKPRKAVLTDQELEIMKIVWQRESVTVRDVYETMLAHRKIAYTTVMTMMGVLETKKYLTKSASERAYVYTPAQPKSQVVGNMVQDFVTRVFNGSAKPLLVHLVENQKLTREEQAEITHMMKAKGRPRP